MDDVHAEAITFTVRESVHTLQNTGIVVRNEMLIWRKFSLGVNNTLVRDEKHSCAFCIVKIEVMVDLEDWSIIQNTLSFESGE